MQKNLYAEKKATLKKQWLWKEIEIKKQKQAKPRTINIFIGNREVITSMK